MQYHNIVILVSLVSLLSMTATAYRRGSDDDHHQTGEEDLPIKHRHYNDDGSHDDDYDHEAVLGSHKDADTYQHLTPEESKERLGGLIDKMDTNKDGIVSREELIHWIIESFKKLDREDANEQLEEKDVDEDGYITFPEYLEKTHYMTVDDLALLQNDTGEEAKQQVENIKLDQQRFDLADVNKDGKLDVTEYATFMHPHNYEHMIPYELQQTLAHYDINKDGSIDLQEFLGNDSKEMDNVTLQNETDHFKKLDKDGNGKLEGDELKQWVFVGFQQASESEADHLIKESDADKDGKLTKNEILDHHDLWVGSQATDYGSHLEDHDEL